MIHTIARATFLAVSTFAALLAGWIFSADALAGSSNSLMDISTDGKLLACANRDSGTVSVVDLATHTKVHEVKVGHHPEGVTFLGKTHQLAIAVYDDDQIVLIDADQGKQTGSVEVFDEPYSVVSNSDGSKIYATLSYPGQIVEIDVAAKQVTRSFDAGPFARGLAIDGTDSTLYVTEYYTGTVNAINIASGKQVDAWPGASNDNLARQIILNPNRPKAYLPHIRSSIKATHGAGSIFPYVAMVDIKSDEKRRRRRVPMDAFVGNRVTSNPWEVAISPDARQFFVVFAGTNDMYACKVIDDDYREIEYRTSIALGNNPRAVRVAPDGKTLYVYNALDFNVVAYDTASLRRGAIVQVTENPLGDEIRQGKILFYSALQPMVGRRWISCASCHPDGEPDGRTWHNPEGLRNTQSLAGMAWTHPIHWSADRDEVQDFEHTIRGQLMQGRGLIKGKVQPSLEAPNKGLSKELDAMAAYANSHRYTLSPHAKGGLSEAAKRGRTIFFSDQTGCAKCHSGPLYCDSQPVKHSADILRHDVGTGLDDPGEKMGPKYDTPSLLGLYRTAPYLHHGAAATIEDVLIKNNPDDKHGKTSGLSPKQVSDLAAFLKSLPYEDPEPAARKAGLVKVER